jgi:hypothetical protein
MKSGKIIRMAIVIAALLAGFGSQFSFRSIANAQSKNSEPSDSALTAADRWAH